MKVAAQPSAAMNTITLYEILKDTIPTPITNKSIASTSYYS